MKKSISGESARQFTSRLLKWHKDENDRKMPWKGEKDPYKIWLSEIILQQTRVEQGTRYYEHFVKHFPTIHHLAQASDKQVFKMWEGLGYYSRCRNLIATAKQVSLEMGGKFPADYEGLKSLKGIGPYTAAAIASFAFNLPYAVVDGNVYRVLARVFGIRDQVNGPVGKKKFGSLAQECLDLAQPAIYNQAIMDFGALVCKPVSPLCETCFLNSICVAHAKKITGSLPLKSKKAAVRKRWFYYLVAEQGNRVLIRQRLEKDVWQQLYEFPMLEGKADWSQEKWKKEAGKKVFPGAGDFEVLEASPVYRQQLSHQLITARFFRIKMSRKKFSIPGANWVEKDELDQYAFPRIIGRYMEAGRF
jgi:A/G-specific adenine glycosylase